MIAEYAVPWVAVESPQARDLAMQWIKAKQELVAAAGWCTYAGIVATMPDSELDLKEIEDLLSKIAKGIGGAQNRVRHTMNGFIIAVGVYVKPLSAKALATAAAIGEVSVPLAAAAIQKVAAAGGLGRKRKTIRC